MLLLSIHFVHTISHIQTHYHLSNGMRLKNNLTFEQLRSRIRKHYSSRATYRQNASPDTFKMKSWVVDLRSTGSWNNETVRHNKLYIITPSEAKNSLLTGGGVLDWNICSALRLPSVGCDIWASIFNPSSHSNSIFSIFSIMLNAINDSNKYLKIYRNHRKIPTDFLCTGPIILFFSWGRKNCIHVYYL